MVGLAYVFMPRYFFHCMDGRADLDGEGSVFADDNAARVQAIVLAGETLRDEPWHLDGGHALRVEVTNVRGELLFTVVTVSIDAPIIAMPKI